MKLNKPFEGLLKYISSKTELKKSDMPDGGANPPPAENGGAQIDDMTTKVIGAFTDGSLEPIAEAVTAYLVQNGTPEAEAADMANMILDAYFDASPEDAAASTGQPNGDEMAAMKSEFAKQVFLVQKSAHGVELLAQGVTKLFEKIEALETKIETVSKDNQVMKSALRTAAGKPLDGATPILKSTAAPTITESLPLVKKREMILEEIKKSSLPLEELSYLNKHMEFSESAKSHFTKLGVKI